MERDRILVKKRSQYDIIIATALCACCVLFVLMCMHLGMHVCTRMAVCARVCVFEYSSACLCVIPREIMLIASMKEA